MLTRLVRGLVSWSRPKRAPAHVVSTPPPRSPDGPASAAGARSGAESSETAGPAHPPVYVPEDVAQGLEIVGIRDELKRRAEELRVAYGQGDRNSDVEALIERIVRPASMVIKQPPLAAQAVLAVCRRRNYALTELTRLIERDPAMSQALLRHANSAFYATPGALPILGIGAAIQRIGTKGVHATVMSRIIQGELSRPGAGFDQMARQVWEHMIRVAPLSRRLARAYRSDPEEAFTLGLLHDVGKLVFFDRVADLRKRKRRDIRLPRNFLPSALATLHEPLGGMAALEWGLDERSATVIATHHRLPPPRPHDPLSEVVHLAELLDLAIVRGQDLDLDTLWEESGLRGPRAPVEAILREAHEEEDAA